MAWIESHQTLARHPKLIRLARTLKTNNAQAIGHLHLFWWWTLDYAPGGDVSVFSSQEVGLAAEWTGDADRFLSALKDCGWIDSDGKVHDWRVYAGRMIQMKENNAERQRRFREKHQKMEEKDRNGYITVTSPLHNALPNLTVPNLTKPVVERERENPDCAHRPSETEVIAYASIIGLAEWRAIDWWREMEGCGWLDHQRRPITRWQPILARVRTKWEADGRPETPPVNKYAANGTTGKAPRPHSLLDLKTIIGANQAAADKLKLQFCSESALGDQWTREDKWKEWKEIRQKIKQLNTQIAALG